MKKNIDYTVIRSDRKTLSIEVKDAGVIVRAPRRVPAYQIKDFVEEHRSWIEKQLAKQEEASRRAADLPKLTEKELDALYDEAAAVIPERVRCYAKKLGVTYGRITIRCQKTRWGSCSAKGNLNFNCLLMLAPPECLDAVVVHELCHLKEMNHSKDFYDEVYKIYPEYDRWNRWLKDNGSSLIARVPQ